MEVSRLPSSEHDPFLPSNHRPRGNSWTLGDPHGPEGNAFRSELDQGIGALLALGGTPSTEGVSGGCPDFHGLAYPTDGTMSGGMNQTGEKSIITMDGRGRVVIPKEVRALMNLTSGSAFSTTIVGNRLELTPVAKPEPFPRPKSGLMVMSRSGKQFDAVSALASTRESRP